MVATTDNNTDDDDSTKPRELQHETALENQYVSLASVKREWQREQEDLREHIRKVSLKYQKKGEEHHAKMMEECNRVCNRTAREEAEMDSIVDGTPSTENELTRDKFVTLFIDPLFDRIEMNDKRLKAAEEQIKEGNGNHEELSQAFNNLKSRVDNISIHKTSAMAVFMQKMMQKDTERQVELDNLWDQMRALGLSESD